MRLAAVHASPEFRIFAATAPSTAASRSASSKTMNAALPPSSIDVRSTLSAHCSRSLRPTSVEPVKESLRAMPERISGSMTLPAPVVGSTLTTPSGTPASRRMSAEGQHRQRRLLGRLDDAGAPGRDGGPDLAGAHGHREVPRGDQQARADRLLRDQEPSATGGRDLVAAVDPDGLLREVPEELRRVERSRPATRPAACPSRASSAAPGRRCARAAGLNAFISMSDLERGDVAANSACASAAAESAVMPSSGEASATEHSTSPVDGSVTSNVAPPAASTHEPPMKSCLGTERTTSCSSICTLMTVLFPRLICFWSTPSSATVGHDRTYCTLCSDCQQSAQTGGPRWLSSRPS